MSGFETASQETQKTAFAALQALAGAEVTQKRLLAALAMGSPSIESTCYLIKSRVKDHAKLVEKVLERRKKKPTYQVTDVTDIIGLRILTLYRSDLPSILQRFLKFIDTARNEPLELFFGQTVSEVVEELIIYGYPREQSLCQALVSQLKAYDLTLDGKRLHHEPRDSGYSSIHIILRAQGSAGARRFRVPVEVQIRTVLEDAWGEVEHELMYKSLYGSKDQASHVLHTNAQQQLRTWKELLDSCGNTADNIRELIKEIYEPVDTAAGRAFPSIDNHRLTRLGLPQAVQTRVNKAVERIEKYFAGVRRTPQVLLNQNGIPELTEVAMILQDCLGEIGDHSKQVDATYYLNMEIALCLLWTGRLLQEAAKKAPEELFSTWSDLRARLRAARVLTRSENAVKDSLFANECLDEAARRYFGLWNSGLRPDDALLAFRLGEVLSAQGEADLAIVKFEEAQTLLDKNPEFLNGKPMRSFILRRLGYAYWEKADVIFKKGIAYGSSEFMLAERRDHYLDAMKVTKKAYEVARSAAEETTSEDTKKELQLSANNLLYFCIEFTRVKGDESALEALGLDRTARRELLAMVVPADGDLDKLDIPTMVDTIREAAQLSGDKELEERAARRILKLLEGDGWRNRYADDFLASMADGAKESLKDFR